MMSVCSLGTVGSLMMNDTRADSLAAVRTNNHTLGYACYCNGVVMNDTQATSLATVGREGGKILWTFRIQNRSGSVMRPKRRFCFEKMGVAKW